MKAKSGLLPAQLVHEVAFHFRLPLTFNMLEMLMRWTTTAAAKDSCHGNGDVNGGNDSENAKEVVGVAYEDLVALMNWKYPVEEERLEEIAARRSTTTATTTATTAATATATTAEEVNEQPELIPLSKLAVSESYKTSSQAHDKAAIGELSTQHYRTFGIPTVRSDLPAPHIKRVSDNKVIRAKLAYMVDHTSAKWVDFHQGYSLCKCRPNGSIFTKAINVGQMGRFSPFANVSQNGRFSPRL